MLEPLLDIFQCFWWFSDFCIHGFDCNWCLPPPLPSPFIPKSLIKFSFQANVAWLQVSNIAYVLTSQFESLCLTITPHTYLLPPNSCSLLHSESPFAHYPIPHGSFQGFLWVFQSYNRAEKLVLFLANFAFFPFLTVSCVMTSRYWREAAIAQFLLK